MRAAVLASLQLSMARAEAADEFPTLLEEHRKIVFKVAASYAWTEGDRADLAQEIATQLCSAFSNYDRARPCTTWMYQVALNTGMAHARAETTKRRFLVEQTDADVDQAATSDESTEEPSTDPALAGHGTS